MRALEIADAMIGCVNALAVLAAPIVLMRMRKEHEARGRTLDLEPVLARYVDLIATFSERQRSGDDGERMVALAEGAALIRARLAAGLDKRNNVDRETIELARQTLDAYGMGAPPEGWDRCTGR